MTTAEFIQRFPNCAPNVTAGRWAMWFMDERWRLRYRWYEFKFYRGHGIGVMVFGLAICITRQGA